VTSQCGFLEIYGNGSSQAETRIKDEKKEEAKRMKVFAQDMVTILKEFKVDYQTSWEQIRPKIEHTQAFKLIDSEEHRRRIFDVSWQYFL